MVKDTINEFQGSSAETGSSIISYLLRTMTPMLLLVYIYILFKACAIVLTIKKNNLKMNTMFLVFSMIAYHSFFIIF